MTKAKGKSKREVKPGDPSLVICDHKGFQITFSNGVCVSVQWGPGNYCADYWDFAETDYYAPKKADYWRSPDAEVAVFWAATKQTKILGHEWLTREAYFDITGKDLGDDVIPAVTPDDVAKYVAWAVAHAPMEKKP